MARVSNSQSSQWVGRPILARLVQVGIYVVPLLAGIFAGVALGSTFPDPLDMREWIIRFVVLGIVSTIVMFGTQSYLKRWLPLTTLLRMSLIFPDEAPTRFAVAMRAGSTKKIEAKLNDVTHGSLGETPAEAAESLLVLLAALSDHDRATRGHAERTRAYTQLIGEEMGLSGLELGKLQWAGLVHDIGKLEIPVEILNKPGRLTAEEFEIIKTHPAIGARLIQPLRPWLGEWADAVGQHHERFDGTGYPNRIAGREISLGARIVAVADAFDVMTAARSYKEPMSAENARKELLRSAGSHFDPVVVRAFLQLSIGKHLFAWSPLSWLGQIPFLGGIATAPAANLATVAALSVASVTAATVAELPAPAAEAPEALALEDSAPTTSTPVVLAPTSTAPPTSAPSSTARASTSTVVVRSNSVEAPRDDLWEISVPSVVPSTVTTTTVVPPSTTTATIATTTTVPPTTTGAAPTTTVAPTTVAPTTSTTTSTAAPTTTSTTTTTTTTTIATTTTTIPPQCEGLGPGVDRSNTDLSICEAYGLDYRNLDLSGANFAGANLEFIDFDGSDLTGADFTGAILTLADFTEADLTDVDFELAGLYEARLWRATGTGMIFDRANLNFTSFLDATISPQPATTWVNYGDTECPDGRIAMSAAEACW